MIAGDGHFELSASSAGVTETASDGKPDCSCAGPRPGRRTAVPTVHTVNIRTLNRVDPTERDGGGRTGIILNDFA